MMNEEEEDRTFKDEQRAIFEQPDDTPVKTRPRTPGERDEQRNEPDGKVGTSPDGAQTLSDRGSDANEH